LENGVNDVLKAFNHLGVGWSKNLMNILISLELSTHAENEAANFDLDGI
jgi:hypothetical protein